MSYKALYRKYRPQTFSDVVGQEHITGTLKNELACGKTVHAYLFTGTRGTGKTSCAKILAKAVNCLNPQNGDPCGECEMCKAIADGAITDICEIDAASNNSVDSIRELREQVTFAPAVAKYRVYIIDEVHMLTISAFNALLKTLEEPPEHVVFILATTEVHKLPATILSRCQRFDFRRIEPSKICERINYIANCEGLTISDDASTLIASAADGGMRDALSILDLCASNNSVIDENVVANVCAMAGNDYLIKLADLIKNQDTEGSLLLLDELHNSSVDMLRLLSELTSHYRDLMIIKTVKSGNRPIVCSQSRLKNLEEQASKYDIKEILAILSILQSSNAAMQSGNRRCEMEMTLIKLCNPQISNDLSSIELRLTALERGQTVIKSAPSKSKKQEKAEPKETDENIPLPQQNEYESTDTKPISEWKDILSLLKKSCPLIAGVLQGSNAYIKGNYLLIDTDNGQFKSMVNGDNATYRNAIRTAAKQVLGVEYKLGPYKKAETETVDPLSAFAEKLKNLEKN